MGEPKSVYFDSELLDKALKFANDSERSLSWAVNYLIKVGLSQNQGLKISKTIIQKPIQKDETCH